MKSSMKMPCQFDDDFLGVDRGFYPDDGPRRVEAHSLVYPPVGFFPFAANGYGDYHGYYWPIGRESSVPIVAFSSHNAYALVPEYSDLSAAARCQFAQSQSGELTPELRQVFIVAGIDFADCISITKVNATDHRALLQLDNDSPFQHCAVGDLDMLADDLAQAESHYRRAIELLPEYGAAHFGLGYLLRRNRRQQDAAIHLHAALIGPTTFWGSAFWADHALPGTFRQDWSRKALLWLRQTRDLPQPLRDDAFMAQIEQLKLTPGDAAPQDFPILIEIVCTLGERLPLRVC